MDPKDVRGYCNRGNALIEKGQYEQAIADYNKALELATRDGRIYYNRGVAYYFRKEYDKTWADITKARDFGYSVPTGFIDDLRKASGRQN